MTLIKDGLVCRVCIYCLVCRDYTKSINPKIVRNRQNRYIINQIAQHVEVKNLDLLKNKKH